MAQRKYAGLSRGSFMDYSTPERIRNLYDNDMSEIRKEASRVRSIIRKRVERMEAAGEVHNRTFEMFGDIRKHSIRDMSDADVLDFMGRMARNVAGGYQSTLSQIQQSQRDWQETLRSEAEENGDDELAKALSKRITPAQWEKIKRTMGMVQKVVGKQYDSNTILEKALKIILGKGRNNESLLTKATRVIQSLGLDDDSDGISRLEAMKSQYTAKGTIRVSWAKAHGKRGK